MDNQGQGWTCTAEAPNCLFRPSFKYSKKVLLVDLRQLGKFTDDLFVQSQHVTAGKEMSVLDEVNGRWGKGVLRRAGLAGRRRDLMKQSYTTLRAG